MKTLFSTLSKSLMAAVVLSASIFSTNVMATEKQPVKISAPKNLDKVVVSGNVEVTLIQSGTEGISYADDNSGKVKVIQDGTALKITSADNEVAKVTVYVKSIYRVMASDDAVVKTDGKLNVTNLQVFLSGNAAAKIDSKTENLYTVISDRADLKLSGTTQNHNLVMGSTPKLNLDRFAAGKTEMTTPAAAIRTAALAK
ncbi:GIN domain-containing protein [Pedobacter sp. GSP4]|uniref:GIN domain-containing protein n=1 Tax=Pedobacter sp. GSP4 TaxID=3453716 RepID=UPI003EE94DB4